jgi:hypothetical protein
MWNALQIFCLSMIRSQFATRHQHAVGYHQFQNIGDGEMGFGRSKDEREELV